MNKKIIISFVIIIIIILLFLGMYKVITNKPNNDGNLDSEFETYSLTTDIKTLNPESNLLFLDDLDGSGQVELKAKNGFKYSFNKAGVHTIEVLELTDDYITLGIEGLAPTKKSGGFSLTEKYDKVTIEKNTGICLNVQATDLYDGAVYFFYIK